MSLIDFRPIKNRYYPGPYSSIEFGTDYHVGIYYFLNSDRKLAIDAACYLQKYYGGNLSRTQLRNQINRETGVFRKWWEWEYSTVYPVSIFNDYFMNDLEPVKTSPEDYILGFNLTYFFMDEILIVKPQISHVYIDYLIAACRYRRIPVFYLVRDNNSFRKEEIKNVNEDFISLMDKSVTEDFEWDEKLTHLYITMEDDYDEFPENGNYYTAGHEQHNIPDVPLQLLKRFDEWHRLSDRLSAEIKEKEYKWLVGAFNYFLKGKYIVKADDESFGETLFDLDKPLGEES